MFRLNNFLNDPYFTKQLGIGSNTGAVGNPQALNIDQNAEGSNEIEDDLEVELTEEEF